MGKQRPLSLPVILGTNRKGRQSVHAARFLVEQLRKWDGVASELIDIAEMEIRTDGAGEEVQDEAFAAKMDEADGLAIVVPEYNHAFPGLLKHVLDTCLKEYIHKPVAIAGVSAGAFGGTRAIQSFLPVARELGLVMTFNDLNFGRVQDLFDEKGKLLDKAYVKRADRFIEELVWMATTLRYGRESVNVSKGKAS